MNNQAQSGPKTASVNIMIPTRAEVVFLAPIVINKNPSPTWKVPAINPRKMSWYDICILFEKKYPIKIAPTPAMNCIGTISVSGNFLTIKINVAKAMGIIKAAKFPDIWPNDKEFPSIKIIPEKAKIIDAKVNFDIFSLRKKYPKIAKKIVCVWIIKLALATVVLYMAKT